jgi:hypothetical protein
MSMYKHVYIYVYIGGTVTQVPPGSFGLYLCLGPSVHPVEEAAAGNVVAIVGIHEYIHMYVLKLTYK